MNSRFLQALNIQKGKIEPYNPLIAGTLGIIMGGQQLVEVPDRPSYVYVMVRSSTEEVIQAFNQQVAPVYGLPVFIQWQGNRYVVVERDTMRYSNWQDFSSYLPRHASTHEWIGSAGDVVFVSQQQFLPLMPMPSGAFGNKEIVINDYNLMTTTGTFQYSPIQITKDLTVWNPTSSTGAQMVLVSMDMTNGGLAYTVGSGSVFSNQLTGTADVLPNIPAVSDISRYLPIAAVRLVTGTSLLTWQNIYDVRPVFGVTSITQGGGGGGGTSAGIASGSAPIWLNNGILVGTGTQINVLGSSFTMFNSGTEIELTILGGGAGPTGALLLNTSNGPLIGPLVIYQQFPNNINQYFDYSTLVAYLSGTSNGNYGAAGEFVNWSTGNSNAVFIDDEAGGSTSLYVFDAGLMNKTTFWIDKSIDITRKGGLYSSPMVMWKRDGNNSTAYTPGASVLVINQVDDKRDHAPSIELDVNYSNLTYLWPNHSGSPFILPIPNYAPYHFDTAANIPTGMVIMQVLNNNLPKFWVGASGYVEAAGGFNTRYGTYDINGTPHTHTGIVGSPGPQGPSGSPGSQGPQGLQGPAGVGGAGIFGEAEGIPLGTGTIFNVRGTNTLFTISGTTLDLFITGTPGAQGPSGSPGSQGPAGPSGSPGSQGPIGPSGSPGSQGPQGATGATGPQGPAGAANPGIVGWNQGIFLGTGTILNFEGAGVTASISGTVIDIKVPGGGGGGGGTLGIFGENVGVPLGTGTILNVRGANAVLTISGTTLDLFVTGSSGGTDPNHAYYTKLAALLEPDALEPFNAGTFIYTPASGTTKYVLASFNTKLGSTASRFDIRNPRYPFPLYSNSLSLIGLSTGTPSSSASAITLDPSIPTYTNARTKYFDRLNTIASSPVQAAYLNGAQIIPLLAGAYGAILVRVTFNDYDWIVGRYLGGIGFNLNNEVSDVTTVRFDNGLMFPVNKKVICEVESAGGGTGVVAYILLPSTWSAVTDPNSYAFRDDFMGASLDTASVWTRAQSSVGNVEIDTAQGWCKQVGNSNWGTNGMHTQTYSLARSAGKQLVVDFYITNGSTGGMIGFNTGAGQSYTNFCHAINCNGTSLEIYEDGTKRSTPGSIATRTVYRLRLTPHTGDQGCKYEIQGGAFGALGSSSFTDITPGTTSTATNTFYPGCTTFAGTWYLGDMRIY